MPRFLFSSKLVYHIRTTIEVYSITSISFQTCSMEVNCESLAVMGATMANGGRCPTTGKDALHPASVRDALSLMHSCGMYNYSGQFAFDVSVFSILSYSLWIFFNLSMITGWPSC